MGKTMLQRAREQLAIAINERAMLEAENVSLHERLTSAIKNAETDSDGLRKQLADALTANELLTNELTDVKAEARRFGGLCTKLDHQRDALITALGATVVP